MFTYFFFFWNTFFILLRLDFFRRTLKTVDENINDADSYSQVTEISQKNGNSFARRTSMYIIDV